MEIPRNLVVIGLVLGFLLLCIGEIAPFWTYDGGIGGYANYGLWWFCLHVTSITQNWELTTCDYIDPSDGDSSINAKYWVMRFTSIFSVVFTLACAINAKRATARNISKGVTGFIAAAAGIITLAVYASVESNNKTTDAFRYDWAFYIYIVGTIIVGLSAILVCFTPSNNTSGQVISHGAPGNMVFMATTSQQQQHYPGGPQYPNANPGYSWQQPQTGSNINYGYAAKQ